MKPSNQSRHFAGPIKKIRIALSPENTIQKYTQKVHLGLEYRPQYALGLLKACILAKRLNLRKIYAFEFGCAGGSGIQDLLYLGNKLHRLTGMDICVRGIDLGSGLCKPESFRDLPYMWGEGFYKCDIAKLESLGLTKYISFGDVATVLPSLLSDPLLGNDARIGFMAFDMDYYSSTKKALDIIRITDKLKFLPRTPFYFDDTLLTCPDTGELRAVYDYNDASHNSKIYSNELEPEFLSLRWPNWIYLAKKLMTLHVFDHPEYSLPAHSSEIDADTQLPL
jgi:hypothetical protein